jgi:hypothetical protein
MFNISFYLERFQAIKDPKIFKREILNALNESTGCLLSDSDVKYQKGVVTVETHSILRSEIYQKRAELIEKLSSSSFIISDIR